MMKAASIAVGLTALGLAGWLLLFVAGAGSATEVAALDMHDAAFTQSFNCSEDNLEENDSQAEARAIALPEYFSNLRACDGDEDF